MYYTFEKNNNNIFEYHTSFTNCKHQRHIYYADFLNDIFVLYYTIPYNYVLYKFFTYIVFHTRSQFETKSLGNLIVVSFYAD